MKFKTNTLLFLFIALICAGCHQSFVKNDLKTIEIKLFEEDFEQIKKKRNEALDIAVLLTSKKDYLTAGFKTDGQFVKSEIRLKGDWTDHLKHRNKWSFRVKIDKGGTFNGMRKFSLQHPNTRNYIYEWAFHKMQEEMGLITMRYDFVNFKLNIEGKVKDLGIFALEEAFDKRMVENNERRSGVVLKFDENALWEDRAYARINEVEEKSFDAFYLNAPIVSFNKSAVIKDSTLIREFSNGSLLLDGYRKNELPSHLVFDLDKMGRFMALVNLLGAYHAVVWHNLRFYFNPTTEKLEPIGFDAAGGNKIDNVIKYHILGDDSSFIPYYKKYLNIVLQDSFINHFLSKNEEEMKHYITILNTEFNDVKFDLEIIKHNQETIRKYLKDNPLSENLDEQILIKKEQLAELKRIDFIQIIDSTKVIRFKKGHWVLEKTLIIPSGFSVTSTGGFYLDMINGAEIISESPFIFTGTKEKPIEIFSSSKTGDGILVKNCWKKSFFEYVNFSNLSNPKRDNWSLTGAVNFYKAPVDFVNVNFDNNRCEDALNIFNTNFSLSNCSFNNTFSDAFDGDFVTGTIRDCRFTNLGNDAIDVSGSNLNIENIKIDNAQDKCISAGEKSKINGAHITLLNSELALASKDLSKVSITDLKVENCKVGFIAFQKKSEFDSAEIDVTNASITNVQMLHLIEYKSKLMINGKLMPNTAHVIDRLYGKEFGKSSK